MRSHELANLLLGIEDKEIKGSFDISTNEEDSHHRVFCYFEAINDIDAPEIILLFIDCVKNH